MWSARAALFKQVNSEFILEVPSEAYILLIIIIIKIAFSARTACKFMGTSLISSLWLETTCCYLRKIVGKWKRRASSYLCGPAFVAHARLYAVL